MYLYCPFLSAPNYWYYLFILIIKCQAKIPDIEKCLDVVATLQAKRGTGEVRFVWSLFSHIVYGCKVF